MASTMTQPGQRNVNARRRLGQRLPRKAKRIQPVPGGRMEVAAFIGFEHDVDAVPAAGL
ncbi:hypothetical protein [Nocardia cyriacigeorgica]|uniref:hypothetical protein n=1 Tax=Nocardia cyriacigeorgica TaxID=135487 RepID=UPI0013D16CD1|nr:hypothetical protein [Nocardia cyriacigeorgica]MBF6455488.1 hypothetical protein [Nocardia cyriacigeorgica]MBF6479620.1 hypothetical protein [Nocardia cyriacigeorgica]MBF6553770.1 hypothetical protein [Nocardia cyriacigeorgica]NEW29930.1 hypothetical protein [Nocardia cyriacigeorgica]